MKLSKDFAIVLIAILVIGAGILNYLYWTTQKNYSKSLESTTPSLVSTPATTESQLKNINSDLKEGESLESDFDTSEIEEMEKDLDPAQFNAL